MSDIKSDEKHACYVRRHKPTGIRAYIAKLILIGPNVKSFQNYSPYPHRNGQAKLTWVAGYIIKMFSGRLRPLA